MYVFNSIVDYYRYGTKSSNKNELAQKKKQNYLHFHYLEELHL